MLLFLNIIKKIYSPCLVSVVLLAYFVVLGVFRCSSQLSIDEAVSKDLDPEAVFSPKF